MGNYLSKSGTRDIFVTNGYGPTVTDHKIMTRKHYVLARGAFRNLFESLSRIWLQIFEDEYLLIFKELTDTLTPDIESISDVPKKIRGKL